MTSFPLIIAAAAPPESSREFAFAHPGLLFLLLLIPALLLLRRRSGSAACVMHPSIRFIAPLLSRPATLAGRIGPVCASLAAASIIVALARPQWVNHYEEQKVSGIDIMIACDLSGSMAERDMLFTGQDENGRRVRRTVDRLTAAKFVMNNFIDGRPNDRIGLVAFAGKAKQCSPLTLDHTIVRYIIEQFYLVQDMGFGRYRPGYIREDGTAIGTAIASAALRLNERTETKSKVIILVTDGVSNRGSITPQDAARQAAELGIKIFPIAIGRDERLSAYTAKVDSIDEETLREIARITGGRYYRASSGTELQKAFASIDSLEKTDAKRRSVIRYDELFVYPMALAALLIALGTALRLARPLPAP